MADFTKDMIIKAVAKGATFLFKSLNSDGGVKYENERSNISGIWVTAEVLESLFSSNVLALSAFVKMKPMIEFLLDTQHDDGSWCVLKKDDIAPPSAISTGHCTYVLKLAMVGGYLTDRRIKEAISKGEAWLRSHACCIEKNGYIFWTAEPVSSDEQSSIDPNISIKSRMEFIFSSFYAIMGFVNPPGYRVVNDIDTGLIDKALRFFEEQSEFFIGQYHQEVEPSLDALSLAKTASTICRLINVFDILRIEAPDRIKNGLKDVLRICSKSPFMATSIVMHSQNVREYTAIYNNNTPFDMANAFLGLGADSETLRVIISGYLEHQNQDGFWYLNFSREYSVNTWTTAEALIVLNRALEQYSEIELADRKAIIEQEKAELVENNNALQQKIKSLRNNLVMSSVISLILSSIDIALIMVWISDPDIQDTLIGNVLNVLIIPLVLWVIKTVWELIKSASIFRL